MRLRLLALCFVASTSLTAPSAFAAGQMANQAKEADYTTLKTTINDTMAAAPVETVGQTTVVNVVPVLDEVRAEFDGVPYTDADREKSLKKPASYVTEEAYTALTKDIGKQLDGGGAVVNGRVNVDLVEQKVTTTLATVQAKASLTDYDATVLAQRRIIAAYLRAMRAPGGMAKTAGGVEVWAKANGITIPKGTRAKTATSAAASTVSSTATAAGTSAIGTGTSMSGTTTPVTSMPVVSTGSTASTPSTTTTATTPTTSATSTMPTTSTGSTASAGSAAADMAAVIALMNQTPTMTVPAITNPVVAGTTSSGTGTTTGLTGTSSGTSTGAPVTSGLVADPSTVATTPTTALTADASKSSPSGVGANETTVTASPADLYVAIPSPDLLPYGSVAAPANAVGNSVGSTLDALAKAMQ